MQDFLTFQRFIAQDILIFFYYIFALVVPLVLWSMRFYILKEIVFFKEMNENLQGLYQKLDLDKKIMISIMFLMIFLCMEFCLRMVFEMMIGYFDMHNYLQTIVQDLKLLK